MKFTELKFTLNQDQDPAELKFSLDEKSILKLPPIDPTGEGFGGKKKLPDDVNTCLSGIYFVDEPEQMKPAMRNMLSKRSMPQTDLDIDTDRILKEVSAKTGIKIGKDSYNEQYEREKILADAYEHQNHIYNEINEVGSMVILGKSVTMDHLRDAVVRFKYWLKDPETGEYTRILKSVIPENMLDHDYFLRDKINFQSQEIKEEIKRNGDYFFDGVFYTPDDLNKLHTLMQQSKKRNVELMKEIERDRKAVEKPPTPTPIKSSPKIENVKEIIEDFNTKFFQENNNTKDILIGVGGDGKVYKHKFNDQEYAIKVYNEVRMSGMEVYDELGNEQHKNVTNSKHLVINDTMYEVMYYYKEGNLGEHLWKFRGNHELQQELFNQLWDALEFLHARDIQHRDLKTGNILIESIEPLQIRVCDFGRSKLHGNSMSITQSVGTFKFMAPEAIAGMPVKESDLFALGIIMAVVASGGEPFVNDGHLFDNKLDWSKIKCSTEMKDVITNLTVADPKRRTKDKPIGWFVRLYRLVCGVFKNDEPTHMDKFRDRINNLTEVDLMGDTVIRDPVYIDYVEENINGKTEYKKVIKERTYEELLQSYPTKTT